MKVNPLTDGAGWAGVVGGHGGGVKQLSNLLPRRCKVCVFVFLYFFCIFVYFLYLSIFVYLYFCV